MSYGTSSFLGIFLGFFTGVIWMLLSVLGYINGFFALIGLGSLGNIINILIAVIGFLAFIIFGLCLFKQVWRMCK